MGKTDAFLEHADAIERGLLDIGRAAKASGVSVKMIRHYEAIGLLSTERFPTWKCPRRRNEGPV